MEEAYGSSQLENQWIDRARSGDLLAFNQLVLSHQDTAFRMAKWIVQDDVCAEDIVQTVFLVAYCQFNRFHGNHFRAWLLKMIRNACIDELRRRKRHPYLSLEPQDMEEQGANMPHWIIDTRNTPEETLIQHEVWEKIDRCLQQLPKFMREVLVLIDIESLDYAETAKVLGIPLGTVKSRLGRARASLRNLLSKEMVLFREG
jgi:RNA polymerase sigma factor (sigma-70 family)